MSRDEETVTQQPTGGASTWGLPLMAVHCRHCGESHLVPAGDPPPRCPLCFQGKVAPQPAHRREEPPEQILPYRVGAKGLAGILNRWTEGVWFRPPEFQGDLLTRRARRYLIPLWLVDGQVKGTWRADVGFDYQVVSYEDRYQDGRGWSSQEVKETRIRWEPRVGRIDRSYDNLAAPALEDHRTLMGYLRGFDLGERVDYAPQAAEEAAVRIPTLDPEAAWPGAEAAFVRAAQKECQQAATADHIRDFLIEAEYKGLNWTLLLLPAYVTWYQEGERVWPVLINGQNGHVSGARRASTRKATITSLVLGGVALLLFLLGGLVALVGMALPPVAVLGGLLLIVGLLVAVVAPLPAIGVWIFNRRSRDPTYT